MHELQLMQKVALMVDDLSQDQGNGRPVVIRLQISGASHMANHTPEELQTTFQIAAQGTRAKAAQLEIVTMPIKGICQSCGRQIERQDDVVICSSCGTSKIRWEDRPEVLITEVDWLEEVQ